MVLLGVLALDLMEYARHRLSHRVPLLWRLHRVHHTDVQVDVTTSLRSHPLEQALRPLFDAAAVLVVGIGPLALAVHAVVQIGTLLFQHANIALPPALDRALAWLIPTPAYHVVHHSLPRGPTHSNSGACLTIWTACSGPCSQARARSRSGWMVSMRRAIAASSGCSPVRGAASSASSRPRSTISSFRPARSIA